MRQADGERATHTVRRVPQPVSENRRAIGLRGELEARGEETAQQLASVGETTFTLDGAQYHARAATADYVNGVLRATVLVSDADVLPLMGMGTLHSVHVGHMVLASAMLTRVAPFGDGTLFEWEQGQQMQPWTFETSADVDPSQVHHDMHGDSAWQHHDTVHSDHGHGDGFMTAGNGGIHTDVAHSDVAHGDTMHADTHPGDVPHVGADGWFPDEEST